jgi:hypothetical protein
MHADLRTSNAPSGVEVHMDLVDALSVPEMVAEQEA